MTTMTFFVNLCSMEMEILANNCKLDYEEYFGLYHNLFGKDISQYISLVK